MNKKSAAKAISVARSYLEKHRDELPTKPSNMADNQTLSLDGAQRMFDKGFYRIAFGKSLKVLGVLICAVGMWDYEP